MFPNKPETPQTGAIGGASSVPPLIDFGDDDNSSFFSSLPDTIAGVVGLFDPFNWMSGPDTEGSTSKRSSLEGSLCETPPASANLNIISNATKNTQTQHSAVGMDLLTGVFPEATALPSSGFNSVPVSSPQTDLLTGSGFLDPLSPEKPSSSSTSVQLGAGTTVAAPWRGSEDSGVNSLSLQASRIEVSVASQNAEASMVSAKLASAVVHESEPSERIRGPPDTKVEGPTPQQFPKPLQPSVPTRRSPRYPSRGPVNVTDPNQPRPSDEFLASRGGKGVYRAPYRGVLNPSYPVSLQLRPHPLNETQRNQATKTILCTDSSLWAASDFGLQVWDISSATGRSSEGIENLVGDEDAAAYRVLAVHGAPTLCLAMDVANQIVWSGHRDGKVRGWPMQVGAEDPEKWDAVYPILVWEGHETPVTAIVVTSYGEIWTGSEHGSMKAWPWEVVSCGLISARAKEGYSAADFVARSSVALRGLVGANSPFQTEVRFLVGDHPNGRVWAGGIYYISLWDARTRELLKILGASVHSDPTFLSQELAQGIDLTSEEVLVSKKDKGLGGWLQRSRNVLMGAADAVRRAADRAGQSSEEGRRLEALVASADGTVWGALGNGLIVQWDGQGNRLADMPVAPVPVKCMLAVGNRLWVGYANGRVQVLVNGKSIRAWGAHHVSLVQMARAGHYVFTLAADGGIRGWHVASPSPLDSFLQRELSTRAGSYTRQQLLRVVAATWNVSEEKASTRSLQMWLAGPAADANMVFVGLQEMEMGAGAIGMAAMKETVGVGLQDKGSANGQWWLDSIGAAVGEGKEFQRLCSRQLAGLLVGVWVRMDLLPFVGDVDAAAVACGFGGILGNKGGVSVKMTVFRRTICVVNSHFAAHQDKVSNRNADFEYVYNQMGFGNRLGTVASTTGGWQNILRGNSRRNGWNMEEGFVEGESPSYTETDVMEEVMPDLSEADVLVWFGDLNYRIDVSYEEALDLIAQKRFDGLLTRDQLRNEMISGRTFPGMREAHIRFPPTYKFDHGSQAYDTSEKKRIPAWCDRILFRDSFDGKDPPQAGNLSRPAKVSVSGYESCMDIFDSDHKPVRCLLNIDLAVIDEAARRREFGDIMRTNPQVQSYFTKCNIIPQTSLSTNRVMVDDDKPSVLLIHNQNKKFSATFTIHCEGEPVGLCPCGNHSPNNDMSKGQSLRGGFGFPKWLQVQPAAGVIGPNNSIAINIQDWGPGAAVEDNLDVAYGQPSWWGNDRADKVVVLVVTVRGSLITGSQRHHLCVCKHLSLESRTRQPSRKENQGQPSQERESIPIAQSDVAYKRSPDTWGPTRGRKHQLRSSQEQEGIPRPQLDVSFKGSPDNGGLAQDKRSQLRSSQEGEGIPKTGLDGSSHGSTSNGQPNFLLL